MVGLINKWRGGVVLGWCRGCQLGHGCQIAWSRHINSCLAEGSWHQPWPPPALSFTAAPHHLSHKGMVTRYQEQLHLISVLMVHLAHSQANKTMLARQTANMARSQCESFLHQVTIDMRECICHHCTALLAAAVLSKSFLHHAAMADG